MILKETLRSVVKSQRGELQKLEQGVRREALEKLDLAIPLALVVTGVRRCGKSTLLLQAMRRQKGFYYFNFEDSRTSGFTAQDFDKLDAVLQEEFGDNDQYFLDEVQSAENWESFVRTKLDAKKRFAITGSNASLLSRELGSKLTGRHLNIELFPFSYDEFLAFERAKPNPKSLQEYLQKGGFPGYLKLERPDVLQQLLNDILARDISVRHGIRNTRTLKEMTIYLLSNLGKEFSYNALKRTFELGSVNTAIDFVSYLEDSYLLFTVPKFSYSLKKQAVGNKKAYCIDNGMAAANTASFSTDAGRMLENAVFLQLRRRWKEIFYFKEENECDFLVKEHGRITTATQACRELNETNKDREVNGLVEALQEFKLERGTIVTLNQTEELEIEGKRINIVPACKWMTRNKRS